MTTHSTQSHTGIGDVVNIHGNAILTMEKHTTTLAEVINALSVLEKDESDYQADTRTTSPFSIEQKIQYNNIKKYQPIFDEYKIYEGKIAGIYQELDRVGSVKKSHLLLNIKTHYLKACAKYTPSRDLTIIRENADNIIEEIESRLLNEIKGSSNITAPIEAVNVGILIVMMDAFTRCKILENPNDSA